MRPLAVRLSAALCLFLLASGCAAAIEGALDSHAERECAEETDPDARRACLDAVEERARD